MSSERQDRLHQEHMDAAKDAVRAAQQKVEDLKKEFVKIAEDLAKAEEELRHAQHLLDVEYNLLKNRKD